MFLTINGVTVDVEYESWREESIEVGELSARTLALRPARARGGKVRRWTFRTTPTEMTAAEMEILADWIEGLGQSWKFDNSLFSGNGVQKTASGTTTAAATGGKFGGKVAVASGSVFGVKMSNKLGVTGGWLPTIRGWSLLTRRKFVAGESASSGWRDLLLKGAVAFTRNSTANPVGVTQYVDGVAAPAANLGRCFSVATADPYTGLHGYKTDNTAADVDFDDFAFYPFQIPTAWVAGIAAWRDEFSWSALPRVKVWGDVFEDGEKDFSPVEVVGTVTSKEVVQLIEDGVVKNTKRVLSVMLEEWATHTTAIEESLAEIVPNALYILDPNDAATLTLVGSEIDDANDANGGTARDMRRTSGAFAGDPRPDLVAGVVNGRDVARFATSGGYCDAALRTMVIATSATDTGSWFTGVVNGAIPAMTRYLAVNFSSIRTAGAGNDDADCVFAGNLHIFSLYVREDSGVRYARVKGRVGGVAVDVEVAGISLSTWHVLAVRHGASKIEIRIDDGAWTTAAAAGDLDSTANFYVGYNGSSGRGFNGDVAFLADYAARHSDAEADQMLRYIQTEVLGV